MLTGKGLISESVIGQVVGFQSSFEVWSRLDRIYCLQSMAKALQLSNQLQAIKKRLRFN